MEQNKPAENICSCDGKKTVFAYCNLCKVYICPACHVAKHISHDDQVIDLAEKCTRYLADYQKLSRLASLMSDRRQIHIKEESIDSIVTDLKNKLQKAKENLQSDISKSTENALKGIEKSPLVQEFIEKKKELMGKSDENLQKLKTELIGICRDLLKNIAENKFETADKAISEEKLKDYENEVKKVLKDSSKDLEFINEVQKLKQTSVEYSFDPLTIMSMIKVQSAVKRPPRIFQFDREKNNIAIFNAESQKTISTQINSGFILPYRFISCELLGNIYLGGGDNNHEIFLKSFYLYDELRGGLIPLANMEIPRSRHSMVSIEDKLWIYAIGGENNNGISKSCEVYDAKENCWKKEPCLIEPRCGHSSCFINDKIYVVGGWNEKYLDSIEKFDLFEKEWEIVKLSKKNNCLKPLQSAGLISLNDHEILIFGGYKEGEELSKNSYVFDLKKLTVEKGKDLVENEAFVASEVKKFGEKIYAFGYVNGGVHAFDIEKNEWKFTKQENL